MSQVLTIVARIQAKKEHRKLVKKEAVKLIEPTRKEQGCMKYEFYHDNENETVLFFLEEWSSEALWQTHMQSEHLKAFVANTEGCLDDLAINQLSKSD